MKKQINRSPKDREDFIFQTRAIIGNDEKPRHFVLVPKHDSLFALPGGGTADLVTLKQAAKNAKKLFKLDTKYPVIHKKLEK